MPRVEIDDRGHKVKTKCCCKRNDDDSRVGGEELFDKSTDGVRLQLVPTLSVRKRLDDEIEREDDDVKLN